LIKINNYYYLYTLESLNEKIYPIISKLKIGDMASFECLNSSPVRWHYPSKGRPVQEYRISPMGYILYIPKVQSYDHQTFTCSGKVNKTLGFRAIAKLKVIGKISEFIIIIKDISILQKKQYWFCSCI